MRLRSTLDRATWRSWGFDLSDSEISSIERFFDVWSALYNQPGVGAYRSQDAIFGSHELLVAAVGPPESLSGRHLKHAVSVVRAGYCVAVVEAALGYRRNGDENLRLLFLAMRADEGIPELDGSVAGAIAQGHLLATVAAQLVERGIDDELPGFELRDAVFTDLAKTLFIKLRLARSISDVSTHVLRLGRALGVCEEALPMTMSPSASS